MTCCIKNVLVTLEFPEPLMPNEDVIDSHGHHKSLCSRMYQYVLKLIHSNPV